MTVQSIEFINEDESSNLENKSKRLIVECVTFVKKKFRESNTQGADAHVLILNICSNLIINCYAESAFEIIKKTKNRKGFLRYIVSALDLMVQESWEVMEATFADKDNIH